MRSVRARQGSLYRCTDCRTTRRVSVSESHSASRPHCFACGSTRLEPATEHAKAAIVARNSRLAGGRVSAEAVMAGDLALLGIRIPTPQPRAPRRKKALDRPKWFSDFVGKKEAEFLAAGATPRDAHRKAMKSGKNAARKWRKKHPGDARLN